MAKITVFGTLRKKFSEIALKVSPKIVLQVRIVICPRKFVIRIKYEQKFEKFVESLDTPILF